MGRILLLVELAGGNDGLNTLIPYADPAYRELRPTIGVPRDRVLQLSEQAGLHEKLSPLMDSWKAGELAVVQGVGYPSPNLSHFRSIEIWDTASASNQTLTEGWVARALRGVNLPAGIGVDCIVTDTNMLPMSGPDLRTIVMEDAESFLRQAEAAGTEKSVADRQNEALAHLLAVRHEVNAAAAGLRTRLGKLSDPHEVFDQLNPLGRQLDLATRILVSSVPIVAIKTALGSFDTHADQSAGHARLLEFLASSLATLRRNLLAANLWNDVVVMTYSEFGRRPKENANAGTDHGTAAPQFVMGGTVKGGLYGRPPSLADLQNGDMQYSVDFRNVFATVARACWGVQCDFGLRHVERLDIL
jgi:uncharacterized protein (DUF1501 family)